MTASFAELNREFKFQHDVMRALYGSKIEITKRTLSARDRFAAIRAIQLELDAALRVLAERRRIDRVAIRKRRLVERKRPVDTVYGKMNI